MTVHYREVSLYNEGSITGMGYLSLVNTEVNWLLRAFALSRSFVIGLSFTLRVGMPMFSRLFALMNDQNHFGFVFRLRFTSNVTASWSLMPGVVCVLVMIEGLEVSMRSRMLPDSMRVGSFTIFCNPNSLIISSSLLCLLAVLVFVVCYVHVISCFALFLPTRSLMASLTWAPWM